MLTPTISCVGGIDQTQIQRMGGWTIYDEYGICHRVKDVSGLDKARHFHGWLAMLGVDSVGEALVDDGLLSCTLVSGILSNNGLYGDTMFENTLSSNGLVGIVSSCNLSSIDGSNPSRQCILMVISMTTILG